MKKQNLYLAFLQHIDALYNKVPSLNYYQLLNVSPQDGIDKVKAQFYKLARIYHPDLHRDLPEQYQIKLDKIFKTMNEAYRVLSEPNYRKYYEAVLKRGELRIDFSKASKVKPDDPLLSVKSPLAKRYLKTALDNIKRKDYKIAKINLQYALTYEPDSEFIKNKLKEVEELLKQKK